MSDWATGLDDRHDWLIDCLTRHIAGDWGSLDPHDNAANVTAVRDNAGRVMSVYPVPAHLAGANPDSEMWVITDDLEDPDTAITLLWPSDY